MKKIVLMVVAMFTMTMSFAENENNSTLNSAEAYDMTVNMRKLAANAHSTERKALVDQAVKKDVRYMGFILDEKQYKKYLTLLNTTLTNRGLK